MSPVRDNLRRQGLVRPRRDRVLAGVCAGLAHRFGISPWLARLLFFAITIPLAGSPVLFYLVLWILMPEEY